MSETPRSSPSQAPLFYLEVLETVSRALLALAAWSAGAGVLAVVATFVVGSWPLLLVLPVGFLGAGLSVRQRAVELRERLRRGQSVLD